MSNQKVSAIVLAAGKGTRMKSDLIKVLHPLAGIPMIYYVMDLLKSFSLDKIAIVVGYQSEKVKSALFEWKKTSNIEFDIILQEEQLGTGHAVLCTKKLFENYKGKIVILYGDVPLLKKETINEMIDKLNNNEDAVLAILTAILENPTGYGRILRNEKGEIKKIIEEKDASLEERKIKEINSGIYCVDKDFLFYALNKLDNKNVQGEYYLTDIVEIAVRENRKVVTIIAKNSNEVIGINDKFELERVTQFLNLQI